MTMVYLLRHGALPADARHRFIGHDDWPLAPEGFAQAEALGEMLRERGIGAIYCSDLLRSRQTAEIIAHHTGVPIRIRRDLREIALGEWEGLSRQEVAARFPDQYAARGADLAHYRIPGGESFADCQKRVLGAWQAILRDRSEHLAIVGHAGANRVLLCSLLGMPLAYSDRSIRHPTARQIPSTRGTCATTFAPRSHAPCPRYPPGSDFFSLGQDYGCVNIIEIAEERVCVKLLNGACHEYRMNDERTPT